MVLVVFLAKSWVTLLGDSVGEAHLAKLLMLFWIAWILHVWQSDSAPHWIYWILDTPTGHVKKEKQPWGFPKS
jgi:cell division protein FtsW (lipid II flippase)